MDEDREHHREAHEPIDWPGTCRLALVVSIAAGLAALLLSGIVGEMAVVVSVIVAGTAASWFQLEHRQPAPVTRD